MFWIMKDLQQWQLSWPLLSWLDASCSTYLRSHLIISRLTWSVGMHCLFTDRQQEHETEKDRDRDSRGVLFFLSHLVFKICGGSKHFSHTHVADVLDSVDPCLETIPCLSVDSLSTLPTLFLAFCLPSFFYRESFHSPSLNTVVKTSFKSLLIENSNTYSKHYSYQLPMGQNPKVIAWHLKLHMRHETTCICHHFPA